MKRLLTPLRRWLAARPRLRRQLTLIVYRFPALDMRLRGLLHANERSSADCRVDAAHLGAPARVVQARLRARMPSR
ncbi:hypothetical protein [Dyella sp. C9]|uniref:hypothetical protein n=1 Tax=Dyella sp. C9 TaxID=2202154 RepID=UPI000DEF805A|nr:hypothetical protein [Dyella sp. C9]